MNAKFYFTLCLVSVLNVSLMAQTITIDSPVSRMVFQRGTDNFATIPVRGSVQGQTTRIQGRLVARQGGQTTDWREGSIQNGLFQLNIPAAGGFYDLELIALAGSTELERQRRERIGVGEVFVVSGQSNNFGTIGQGLPASDDRVSVMNQRQVNSNEFNENALPMAFSQAGPGTSCGPLNPLFIWGGLGDRLVARLGVPVLFLGVSQPGSATKNWREAAQGVDRVSGRDWYNNTPYRPLKLTMQHYTSQLGVRGVLWHQGESDNMYQTTDGYVENMRILIAKTREDSRFSNLSWMIARATYFPYPGHEVDPGIIAGQNRVINETSNCFPGPYTDEFIGPAYRKDQVHFSDYAYPFLADLWSQSLSTEYFQRSQPSLPNVGPASPVASSDKAVYVSVPTIPTNTNPPASTGTLQLGSPDYTCQSGVITFRVASTNGSGNPVEFMAPGVTGWTTNPTHTLGEGVRRDAQTLTIFARQSGQETSQIWSIRAACDGSVVAPPVVTQNPSTNSSTAPQPPVPSGNATGGSFALLTPGYNCQTGAITFNTSGGNGSTVEYMAPGVTIWTTNATHTLAAGLRHDAQTLTIFARQSGQETSLVWNLRSACDGSAPAPVPSPVVEAIVSPAAPTGAFALATPTYDCQTGTLTLKTSGGNGNTVEYMAPGVTVWTTNATHVLGAGLRHDAQTLTIFARQSGQQVSLVWNLRGACTSVGVARVAQKRVSMEPKMVVMPNPSTDQVQLVWPGIANSDWTSRFVSASGYEMSVPVSSNEEGLQATIKHLATGVYLWQVAVRGFPPLTFRVMKVE